MILTETIIAEIAAVIDITNETIVVCLLTNIKSVRVTTTNARGTRITPLSKPRHITKAAVAEFQHSCQWWKEYSQWWHRWGIHELQPQWSAVSASHHQSAANRKWWHQVETELGVTTHELSPFLREYIVSLSWVSLASQNQTTEQLASYTSSWRAPAGMPPQIVIVRI